MCDIMRGDVDEQARDSRIRRTRRRDCDPPLPEPWASFLTWPTYGTWLPGDKRRWVEYRHGWQLRSRSQTRGAGRPDGRCLPSRPGPARLVELTIADHCRVKGWTLYTVNCRSNQVHVIVAGKSEAQGDPGSSSKPGAPAGSRRCSRNVSVHSPHMIPRPRQFARNGGLSVGNHTLCQRRGRP